MSTKTRALDEQRLEALAGQAITDIGAALNGALVMIGDHLGLWKAMADGEPTNPTMLAERVGVPAAYLHEWMAAQAASGYLEYDDAADMFTLSPEQAMVFADANSPAYMVGGYHIVSSVYRDYPRIAKAMTEGHGFGWHEHDPELFMGTEQFFRPGYRTSLTADWVPALDGMEEKLRTGAKVADIGCGHGTSTTLLAREYPASTVHGFDYHESSIQRAMQAADEAGVSANTEFAIAKAKDFPGTDYDLICFFDCLHDMGDPLGALEHARRALADDGAVMLVEPFAQDRLADNMNPVGRVFYAASTVICTPSSLSQEVATGLGAQAGEARLHEIATAAGFTRFRRATETPVNLILELRP